MLFQLELKLCSSLRSVDMGYVGRFVLVFAGRALLLYFLGIFSWKSSTSKVQGYGACCK